MKIFNVVVLVCICALVTLGTVFSGSMFQSLSIEGSQTVAEQNVSVQQYLVVHAWVYIIAILLLIAVIVVALKLFRESADDIS
jgi:Ca2+/Na+ antiporter